MCLIKAQEDLKLAQRRDTADKLEDEAELKIQQLTSERQLLLDRLKVSFCFLFKVITSNWVHHLTKQRQQIIDKSLSPGCTDVRSR